MALAYTPINYVSDYAEIIPPTEEAQINSLAASIEQNSTVEIAVLTVPSLDGQDKDSFAVDTFKQWGIGKKDVDNGLLILIAPNEREWRIEVGYGLEPVLTDAMAGRIGREHFIENFRAGNYGKGIYDAIEDINKVIQNDETIISKYSENEPVLPTILLFIFLASQTIIVFATSAHKKKSMIRLSSAAIMAVILLFLNVVFAIIFSFFALSMLAPWSIGPGGFSGRGLGGFRGGFGGFGGGRGGFGGFGGGSSGGGGAGGKW